MRCLPESYIQKQRRNEVNVMEETKKTTGAKKTALKETAKDTVKKAAEAAAPAAKAVKEAAAPAAKAVKETAAPAAKAVKETAAPAAKAVKKETAKAAEKAKTAVKKTAEKAAAKKEITATVSVQFSGKSYTTEELVAIAKDVWKYDLKQKASDFKSVELYVKPEENQAYYVINGEHTGSFFI